MSLQPPGLVRRRSRETEDRRTPIPRDRPWQGVVLLSAGFRPFFLLAAIWAAVALPLWLAVFAGDATLPTALPPLVWHVHEMVFGFAAAVVAGFLLTAIPNWTGRLPLQGWPLGGLVGLWLAGRVAVMASGWIGPVPAAVLDLAFPAAFLAVVAREILAGRNWRNLPVVAALSLLLIGNALVHAAALGLPALSLGAGGGIGNRLGLATLLGLIGLIGGRVVPSFTRNWLARHTPDGRLPAPFSGIDRIALALTVIALLAWVVRPDSRVTALACVLAGSALLMRLARWRGSATWSEKLLFVLHLGYFWLGFGLLLLGGATLLPVLPPTAALHALTVGAIGTMTLAMMTRATRGHAGRPLQADRGTTAIYALITAAAVLRVAAPLTVPVGGLEAYLAALALAGAGWCGAFGLFAVLYGPMLALPRPRAAG